MANYHLKNSNLSLTINSLGAEIKSLFSNSWNKEIIWNADASVWARSAPILFPIVGKLKDNQYHLHGKDYSMSQHGFARDFEFQLTSESEDELSFTLLANQDTFKLYPFCFFLNVSYKLEKEKLHVSYEVVNDDRQDIYFSIGAHPAFNTPNLEHYNIVFEKEEDCFYRLQNGYLNWNEPFLLEKNKLSLSKELFVQDALVFKKLNSRYVDLLNTRTHETIRVHQEDANYFGIWAKGECPFICLEPWDGVSDSEEHDKVFTNKRGIITLKKGAKYTFSYTIEFIKDLELVKIEE